MVSGLVVGGLTLMLNRAGMSDHQLRAGWALAFVLVLAGALAAAFWKRGRVARRLDSLIGRRDRLQRRRNDRIYATSITGWGLMAICIPSVWRVTQGEAPDAGIGFVVGASLSPLLTAMDVAGWGGRQMLNRRWLEDEVTRDIRRRALSMGFLVLLPAMWSLFMLGLWRVDWAMLGFLPTLMMASSVVGLRFVWLDQRAEGGEVG